MCLQRKSAVWLKVDWVVCVGDLCWKVKHSILLEHDVHGLHRVVFALCCVFAVEGYDIRRAQLGVTDKPSHFGLRVPCFPR